MTVPYYTTNGFKFYCCTQVKLSPLVALQGLQHLPTAMRSIIKHITFALAAIGHVSAAPWSNVDSLEIVARADAPIPNLESVPADKLAGSRVVTESKPVATTDPQARAKGYGTLCVCATRLTLSKKTILQKAINGD